LKSELTYCLFPCFSTDFLSPRWIKKLDVRMKAENRHVLLTIDNFSGHSIDYEPTNIQIEFFEPNMTSFVQPLDAGIIRCFKAHYRKQFCRRAVELDELGEREIFKIDLKEAMEMAMEAWDAVTPETIKHCWDHTGIQPCVAFSSSNFIKLTNSILTRVPKNSVANALGPQATDEKSSQAWLILRDFATSDMRLPEAEKALENLFGGQYEDSDWRPGLKAVMDAEGDIAVAQDALDQLSKVQEATPAKSVTAPLMETSHSKQLVAVETELMASVAVLRTRNRVFGPPMTVDDIVDPPEERETSLEDSPYAFPGGDDDIINQVDHESKVARGEVMEIDDESDDESEDLDPEATIRETLELAAKLERLSIKFGGKNSNALGLNQELRKFRSHLKREDFKNVKQSTIDLFFHQP